MYPIASSSQKTNISGVMALAARLMIRQNFHNSWECLSTTWWRGARLLSFLSGYLLPVRLCRYGASTVGGWRFRLGTETDGPRYGSPWGNSTYAAMRANGTTFNRNQTDDFHALIATYAAVGHMIKSKVPSAGFGPSNMAGVGVEGNETGVMTYLVNRTARLKHTQNCCQVRNRFEEFLFLI